MKKFIKLLLFSGALALATGSALATGYNTSFNITNVLVSGAAITSYPTNTAQSVFWNTTTNGSVVSSNYYTVGEQTGNGVAIYNYDHIGINFQAVVVASTNTANQIGTQYFVLIPSMAGGPPNGPTASYGVPYAGGVTNVTANDWASGGFNQIQVAVPIIGGTNYVNWQTNFPTTSIFADANYIGVYVISNNLPSTCLITNAVLSVNKKLIPKPLIGQ